MVVAREDKRMVAVVLLSLAVLMAFTLILVIVGEALKVPRKSVSLNERMRSLYYIPVMLFGLGLDWKLIQSLLDVEWGPRWLTYYATSLFAPQLVAFAIFSLVCNKDIREQPQTLRGTNAQMRIMMTAQVVALAILLGWEAFNQFVHWAPFWGKWDWWDVALYILSFLYGCSVNLLWRNRATQNLENP